MPANYAHYRFGKKVYRELNESLTKIIRENMNIFFIGLHGPDILFYNNIIKSNRITRMGHGLHDAIASGFFMNAKKVICESEEHDAALAYTLGFICHFVLDSECHGFIEYKKRNSSMTHSRIETELERSLMISEGKDPHTYDTLGHIEINDRDTEIISEFFRTVDEKEIKRSLKNMKKVSRFLICRNRFKLAMIKTVMFFSGDYNEYKDLIMRKNPDDNCIESTFELRKRYKNAKGIAVELLEEFWEDLYTDSLNIRFARTYGVDNNEIRKYEEVFCDG